MKEITYQGPPITPGKWGSEQGSALSEPYPGRPIDSSPSIKEVGYHNQTNVLVR